MSNTKTELEQEYDHLVATANAVAIEHHHHQNQQQQQQQQHRTNMMTGAAPAPPAAGFVGGSGGNNPAYYYCDHHHHHTANRENIPPTSSSSSVPVATAAASSAGMMGNGNQNRNQNDNNKQHLDSHDYIHNICGNRRSPVMVPYCPNCTAQNIQTKTSHKYTGTTVAMMVGGAVVFWPAAFIPMFSKSFKQTNHHCSSCGAKIGRVKVLS